MRENKDKRWLERMLGEIEAQERMYTYADADLLVKAKVSREDIQMLAKLAEGLGHLGTVTTTNKAEGEVLLQTTKDCWPDLRQAILSMPFAVEFLE